MANRVQGQDMKKDVLKIFYWLVIFLCIGGLVGSLICWKLVPAASPPLLIMSLVCAVILITMSGIGMMFNVYQTYTAGNSIDEPKEEVRNDE